MIESAIKDEAMSYVTACLGSGSCRKRAVDYISSRYHLTKEQSEKIISAVYDEWAEVYNS